MFTHLRKWHSLRSQILIVFLFVMVIVLFVVGYLTLNQVSSMLKKNAEEQTQQVAIEASGRVDSLYEQINIASKFVITNDEVQEVLDRSFRGQDVSFSDRQQLQSIVNNIQVNSDGVFSMELYNKREERLLPLDNKLLSGRIGQEWIERADEAKGSLVWIGSDPQDPNHSLVIRRINLMNHGFANAGYLVMSIYNSYFPFANQDNINQYSILLDNNKDQINSNYDGSIESIAEGDQTSIRINEEDYMVTKETSDVTGFMVLILTPVSALTEGIDGIRNGIVLSGILGIIIYFICSWLLSTIITKPIINLTNTMQRANEGLLATNPQMLAVSEITELNSTYNRLAEETNHLIQMVYQKEINRSQSELKALQAQINPHFLYNTLDALRWSLEEKDEEELAETVIAMSDLFRYTITKDNEDDWVTLKAGFKHIEDYLEVSKLRFGDRLKWNLSLPKELEHIMIPKLVIQPFVENAVVHGVGNKVDTCTVKVSIKQVDKEYIQVLVQDDGPGMDEANLQSINQSLKSGGVTSSAGGKGMAISNVYKRLQLYYKDRLRKELQIQSEVNKGTEISFEIPVTRGE
ncbi:sensor histidine kinase [Oceanobacillus halophilus]|uniref:histidine kinase n=1 Tax=Oceanobacillus halophilus TaxID=930130 RepID=A0A495A193_9BACI|nr:sensor histidine kinase [Oceanobacillus halophilus]RKQ32496.1 sensor histidine kinase [Oceanobacillus halophilus]